MNEHTYTLDEVARLNTAWENTMIANVDIAMMNGELQIRLAEARAALAFVVKVRPLVDTLGRQAVNTYINMDLVEAAFEAAAAFLAAHPEPAQAEKEE